MSLEQVPQQDAEGLHLVATDALPQKETLAFKFGGTSLLGAKRLLHAAGLVCDAGPHSRVVGVVSAMKCVTDRLLRIAHLVSHGSPERARFEAEFVVRLHEDALSELAAVYPECGRASFHDLRLLGRDLLHDVSASRRSTSEAELCDRLASFGERFSARLFSAALAACGV